METLADLLAPLLEQQRAGAISATEYAQLSAGILAELPSPARLRPQRAPPVNNAPVDNAPSGESMAPSMATAGLPTAALSSATGRQRPPQPDAPNARSPSSPSGPALEEPCETAGSARTLGDHADDASISAQTVPNSQESITIDDADGQPDSGLDDGSGVWPPNERTLEQGTDTCILQSLESLSVNPDASSTDAGKGVDLEEEHGMPPKKRQCHQPSSSEAAQTFLAQFKQPEKRDLDKPRSVKTNKPPVGKRGTKRKNGSRLGDVSGETLRKRPSEFPDEGLEVRSNQLFCTFCSRNIASQKAKVIQHCATDVHKQKRQDAVKEDENKKEIQLAIEEFKEEVAEVTDGATVKGLVCVASETQAFRAECLEEWLKAGIVPNKLDKMRPWIERKCGHTLSRAKELVSVYIRPLQIKYITNTRAVLKDEDVGIFHDGTTHEGESFAIIYRACPDDGNILERAGKVGWYKGSLNNKEITAVLITTTSTDMLIPLLNVLDIGNDDASPNSLNYENLEPIMPYADHDKCSPHTGNHTGEALNAPLVEEFMKDYNVMVSKSNWAKVYYKQVAGHALKSNSGSIRWWVENEIVTESIQPYLSTGKIVEWLELLANNELCAKTSTRLLKMLKSPSKMVQLQVEALMHKHTGSLVQSKFTLMEGNQYSYLYAYRLLMDIHAILKNPITEEVKAELSLRKIAPDAPGCTQASTAPQVTNDTINHSDHRARAMLNNSVTDLLVSIGSGFWNWPESGPTQDRFEGRCLRWTNKGEGKVCILFEGAARGETCSLDDPSDTNGDCTYLLQPGLDFRIEGYADGRPAPNAPAIADTSLLSQSNLKDPEVLVARAKAVVAPALAYFDSAILNKRHLQVARFKAAQIFDPLYVQESATPVTVADVHAVKAFKFSQRPDMAENSKKWKKRFPCTTN